MGEIILGEIEIGEAERVVSRLEAIMANKLGFSALDAADAYKDGLRFLQYLADNSENLRSNGGIKQILSASVLDDELHLQISEDFFEMTCILVDMIKTGVSLTLDRY